MLSQDCEFFFTFHETTKNDQIMVSISFLVVYQMLSLFNTLISDDLIMLISIKSSVLSSSSFCKRLPHCFGYKIKRKWKQNAELILLILFFYITEVIVI